MRFSHSAIWRRPRGAKPATAGGGFFKECFEWFLCERYRAGEQAFPKPRALAEAFRPVLAVLAFLSVEWLFPLRFKLLGFLLNTVIFSVLVFAVLTNLLWGML